MRQIGHYSLIDEIGRGGQATVFLAEDSRLKRRVALKVLGESAAAGRDTLERFRREAALASRLDHPAICPIYEAGVEDGVPFIAMRYLEGETLARRIARLSEDPADVEGADFEAPSAPSAAAPSSGPRARLRREEIETTILIIEKIARALHAAHEVGIVHRDIKPANVMVTPGDEPVLLDLGLARDEQSELLTLTRTGDSLGTPAYMAPEQLTGQRIRSDRRTDVYALGATLYESLTLRRPFDAPTREGLYQAILTDLPRDPLKINPRIPVELKVVIETALEKNRNRRYQTALALAEDLARVRKHEPIEAKPPGPILRLRRWVQRKPTLAAGLAGGLIALALLGYAIGASGKAVQHSRLRRYAEAEVAHLDEHEKDAAIARVLPEIETQLGTILFAGAMVLGPGGTMDLRPLLERYVAAFEAFGLPFRTSGGSAVALGRLETLRARNPAIWDVVTGAIVQFADVSKDLRTKPGRDARTEALLRAADEATAVRRVLKPDSWEQRIRAAEIEWATNGNDVFGDLLAPAELRNRSGTELGRLASAMFGIPDREAATTDLLDRAIDLTPDDYQLHMVRGGLALMNSGEHAAAGATTARHHYSIARALRPKVALPTLLLGVSTVMTGDYERAGTLVDRATALEPNSALIWLMAADFWNRSPLKAKAASAARRALELDPSIERAAQILKQAGAAESR